MMDGGGGGVGPTGFAAFRAALDAGRGQILVRERVADLETPVGAFLKLAHGQAHPFLLESVEGGSARGRYSAIGFAPDLVWRCRGGRAELNRHALSAPHAFAEEEAAPLDSLRAVITASQLPVPPGLPPSTLMQASNYLNARLAGRTLDEAKAEIEERMEGVKTTKAELEMAKQLVESLSEPFDPSAYENEHKRELMQLIERKQAGEVIEVPAEAPRAATPAPDLMSALKASLEQAKKADGGAKRKRRASANGAAKKAPGKRRATKAKP